MMMPRSATMDLAWGNGGEECLGERTELVIEKQVKVTRGIDDGARRRRGILPKMESVASFQRGLRFFISTECSSHPS